jgi:hypothetical protein
MDRRGPLLSLARRLDEASLAKNWPALEQANADTSRIVVELHAQGPWQEQERPAFEKLRQAHARARYRCTQALGGVSLQLAEMATHREGWLAYAAAVALVDEGDANAVATSPLTAPSSKESKK